MRRRVIGFTGLDGTGKSTQSSRLEQRLRQEGWRVVRVHQYEAITRLGQHLKRSLRSFQASLQARLVRPGTVVEEGSPGRPRGELTSGVGRSAVLSRLLAAVWLVDGWWRGYVNWKRYPRCDFLILDRCFVDEIVRTEWKLGSGRRWGLHLLRRFPIPDLLFELQVDEETGWGRKKAWNMAREEYDRKRWVMEEVMLAVRQMWPVCTIRVDGRGIEEVAAQVYEEVIERFKS